MKHKQLITMLKNKGFFLTKKTIRKTDISLQKRIIDKERSYYSIALSPYREDLTEICRLFSDGRLQISKVASNFFERGISSNCITLTDAGMDSEQGLTYFNVEKIERNSDLFNLFRFIKENEISILYEIIHNI